MAEKDMQSRFIKALNEGSSATWPQADLAKAIDAVCYQVRDAYASFGRTYLQHTPMHQQKEQDMATLCAQVWQHFPKAKGAGAALCLGPGDGQEMLALHAQGFKEVYGIENSPFFVAACQETLASAGYDAADVQLGDVRDLKPYGDESLHALWCYATLLHVPYAAKTGLGAEAVVQEAYRVLKKGGVALFHVRAGKGAYVQKETGRFFQLFQEADLRHLLQQAGFKVLRLEAQEKEQVPSPAWKEWLSVWGQKA